MTGPFLGVWMVSEYVYNPHGVFAGVVHQRRELTRLENGNLRVWQLCEPCDFDHPIAQRVGEYVFDLRIEGRARRYLGPDVVGSGLSWGEGVLTARGLWPRFGHNFTSFSMQTGAERQVTGGKFFNAGEMVANIVGVAEAAGTRPARTWPRLDGPTWPGEVSECWRGKLRTLSAEGTLVAEWVAERRYDRSGWEDAHDADSVRLEENGGPFLSFSKNMRGIARRYGWMLEGDMYGEAGVSVEWMDVLDGGELTGLRRWRKDEAITRVEVLRLTPA
jgi:hypothetical protein